MGRRQHWVCGGCVTVRVARWSPDGQAVALSTERPLTPYPASGGDTSLVYSDGSCLDCPSFGGMRSAFTSTPGLLSTITGGDLFDYGSDGLQQGMAVARHVSDAVWSAQGKLAVVRGGRVLAGRPGRLRALGKGSDPSWAPDGSRLAVVRRGWVTVLGVKRRVSRRLARGTRPAFSPDGKWIAFIGKGHRLSVVSARTGRIRRVGRVRGQFVDWQPVVANPPTCLVSSGATIAASSPTALMTSDSAPNADYGTNFVSMGCLRSTGRARLLARYDFQSIDSTSTGDDFVLAGKFGAFIEYDTDPHYGGSREIVHVFDLGSGQMSSTLGGEQSGCSDYSYSCASGAGQLVMNDLGFTAVITSSYDYSMQQAVEQIMASDSSGVRVLDSATSSSPGGPPQLTGLQLTGNTLTWTHGGSPRSAQLG